MNRSKRLQHVIRFSLAAATAAMALPAYAADNVTLAEVVVTAQKREESLTEVPVAISVFTSEQRDLIGITSVVDMANFTPGFVYNQGQDRVSMRGIGRYTNQLGADSSVGVYEDGAFETFTVKAGNSSLYTDRIEILRGPQGTLYGRNSIGGAMNIISRRPTKDPYSEVRASYDNYGQSILEGALSGPITDNLLFRLVGTKLDQERGYFKNIGGGASAGNVRDEWVYEAQLSWQLGENDEIWLKAFGGDWNNGAGNAGGRTGNQVIVGPDGKTPLPGGRYPVNGPGNTLTTNALVPSLGIGFTAPSFTSLNPTGVNPGNNNIREIYSDIPQYVKLNDYYGAILHYNHAFSFADLKYIGHAQHYNYFEALEYGEAFTLASGMQSYQFAGQAAVFPNSLLFYQEKHSLNTNEINLISSGDGPVQWVAGVYNFNEYYEQPVEIIRPGQAQLATPLLLGPTGAVIGLGAPNPHRAVVYQEGVGGAKTLAGYGQIDWSFTDTWKATLGLRYTKDWKWGWDKGRLLTFNPAAGVGLDVSQVTGVSTTLTYPGATGTWADPATGIYTRRLEGEWSGVTGTAGMQWTPDAKTNLYFKYSRGFKSGGFNIGAGNVPNPQTNPEHSNDFQLGYKRVYDTFQVNIDVFYDQYYDAQIPIGAFNASTGLIATQFFNIPEAASSGVEVEATWQATNELQFIFNYGYNHTLIVESGCLVNAAGDATAVLTGSDRGDCPVFMANGTTRTGLQVVNGNQLPNAPKNKLAFNTNYTLDLDSGSLLFSVSYLWRDAQYGSVFNTAYNKAPHWDQTDARIQFKPDGDHLTLIAFSKNVFDSVGYPNGANGVSQTNATGAHVGFIKNYPLTPPRTYGLELQYKF